MTHGTHEQPATPGGFPPGPVDVATVKFIAEVLQESDSSAARSAGHQLDRALAALPPQQHDEPGVGAFWVHGPATAVSAPAPVREWGVRHGDDCRLNHGQMRPGTYATREAAEEGAQYIKGRGLCIPVVVSRTPGGVWEPVEGSDFGALVAGVSERAAEAKFGQPVEQEEATEDVTWRLELERDQYRELARNYQGAAESLGENVDRLVDENNELKDTLFALRNEARFSVAEIEAALHPIAFRFGREYNADSPSGLSQDIAAHLLTALRAGREGEQG